MYMTVDRSEQEELSVVSCLTAQHDALTLCKKYETKPLVHVETYTAKNRSRTY